MNDEEKAAVDQTGAVGALRKDQHRSAVPHANPDLPPEAEHDLETRGTSNQSGNVSLCLRHPSSSYGRRPATSRAADKSSSR